MNTGTVNAKENEIKGKMETAKKKVARRKVVKAEGCQNLGTPEGKGSAQKANHEADGLKKVSNPKKKEPKVLSPKSWLENYISQGEQTTSGARLCTYLMCREGGADIHEIIQRCTQIAELKASNWGKSRSSILSHCAYLKQKGLQVKELKKDVFKVSA